MTTQAWTVTWADNDELTGRPIDCSEVCLNTPERDELLARLFGNGKAPSWRRATWDEEAFAAPLV